MPARPVVQRLVPPRETYEAVPPPAPTGGGVAMAGPAGASMNLDQASDLAVRNNPVLAQAQAQIDSKIGTAIQAGIWANPRYDTNNPQVFNGSFSQYNVGFQQEIPVMGKLRLDRAAAMQDVSQARFAYIHQRFDLLTAVRQQFYRVLAQERRVAVLSELVEIATRSHAAAQQREKAGQVAETDVLLLLIELQQARIALENARLILYGSRRALSATIGLPMLEIRDALGDLTANLPDFEEGPMRAFIANQNAQIQEAQLQITQNRILLQRAQVEPYPNIYTGPAVAFGPSSSSTGGSGSQYWYNIQFNIPVWNLNQGGIRSGQREYSRCRGFGGRFTQRLAAASRRHVGRVCAARDRSRYIGEQILPTAERTFRLMQNAYEIGAVDVAPVLQAQKALTQVNLDYIEALESAWTNAAALAGLLQVELFP